MKKTIILLFVALVLSACGKGTGLREINIAVVGKAATPYWKDVELGAKAAGQHLGVSVKFFAPSGEAAASWQIRKIEELAAKPVDGIAFAAEDPKSLAPYILRAMNAEIPCLALDTDVGKSRHVYMGTSDYQAGEQAGEKMLSLLDGKGKIAIIASSSGSDHSLKRVRGFRDVIAEYADVKIGGTIEKEDGIVQTSDVESLLSSYPDLDGIFCTSDPDGLAAAAAVEKAGQIKIVCIGESPDLMKYVRDDFIQAAVARRPYRMGYLSVLVLHNMARVGIQNALKILPKSEIIDTGIVLVTPMNIIQYREQLKELGIEVDF